jgi:hypothetical protein
VPAATSARPTASIAPWPRAGRSRSSTTPSPPGSQPRQHGSTSTTTAGPTRPSGSAHPSPGWTTWLDITASGRRFRSSTGRGGCACRGWRPCGVAGDRARERRTQRGVEGHRSPRLVRPPCWLRGDGLSPMGLCGLRSGSTTHCRRTPPLTSRCFERLSRSLPLPAGQGLQRRSRSATPSAAPACPEKSP